MSKVDHKKKVLPFIPIMEKCMLDNLFLYSAKERTSKKAWEYDKKMLIFFGRNILFVSWAFLWVYSESNELMSEIDQNLRTVDWSRDDALQFYYLFFSFTCLGLSLCSSWRVELLIWVFEGQTEINMDC